MKIINKWLVGVFLTALMLLGGCGMISDDLEGVETKEAENLIVVGVSQVGSESVWRTENTNSIQRVFTKDNGYFLIFDNARQKQENQIKAIRSFISQKVDYIVFSPITEDGWDTVLQEAKDAGIPVILMDREVNVADESLYLSWVGSDFLEEGKQAGKWLERYLEEKGLAEEEISIAILSGTKGSSAEIGRSLGFRHVKNKHANWKIIFSEDGEYTTSKAKELTKKMMSATEKPDIIVSHNDDMTFGAIEVLEEMGYTYGIDGEIQIISFDAVSSALEMVANGEISVDMECNPEQGSYVESIIKKHIHGEEIEKRIYVPERVFTKENVNVGLEDRLE